jgi:hypothetical protein
MCEEEDDPYVIAAMRSAESAATAAKWAVVVAAIAALVAAFQLGMLLFDRVSQ